MYMYVVQCMEVGPTSLSTDELEIPLICKFVPKYTYIDASPKIQSHND